LFNYNILYCVYLPAKCGAWQIKRIPCRKVIQVSLHGEPLATFKRDNRKLLSGFSITYGSTQQHSTYYITAWTYETGPFDEQKVHCHCPCDMGLKVQILLV